MSNGEDLSVAQAIRVLQHQAARHREHAAIGVNCCPWGKDWHLARAEDLEAQAEALRRAGEEVLNAP